MKKMILLTGILACLGMAAGQPGRPPVRKMRHTAAVDDKSSSARKLSVRFTDGLKAYYTGNDKEAMAVFNGILLDNPKHDASCFMLAKVYKSRNMLQEAALALRQAAAVDKKNIWYKAELAGLYMEMEDYAAAARLWEEVCRAMNYSNEYYLYSLACAYINLEKYAKAIGVYEKMEDLVGYDDDIIGNKVSLWLMMDKVREAVGEYERLIAKFPYDAGNYVKAGRICQSNGRHDEALHYYMRAAAADPGNPEVSLALAHYWEQQGDTGRQMQYLSEFFASPRADVQTQVVCLKNLLKRAADRTNRENTGAVEKMAAAFTGTHPERAEGHAILGSVCVMLKQYARAKDEFEKSFAHDMTVYATWEDYCYVLDKLGAHAGILKYEDDIQSLFPTSDVLAAALGRGHLAAGNADKAIEYLKRAVSYTYVKSRLPGLYRSIGEAYRLKGDGAAAGEYLRKAGE